MTRERWWEPLYDDLLAELLLVRADEAELDATLGFLTRALALEPGQRVFDQCCGIGSLAVPLAARGLELVCVDQAERYVARAKEAALARGVTLEAHAADAHDFVAPTPCQAAFNWWTSFGYTPDDAHNARMFARVRDSLVLGGRFALDTLHLPGVLRHFQRDVVTQRSTPEGEITLWRQTHLELEEGMMAKRWTYLLPDGTRRVHQSRLRLYLPHQLARMLEEQGFEDLQFYGSVKGEPLGLDSPRCICVARRAR